MKNIKATTKRVTLSFTYEELTWLDEALWDRANRGIMKKGEDTEMFDKVRPRILKTVNKWYDMKRFGTSKALPKGYYTQHRAEHPHPLTQEAIPARWEMRDRWGTLVEEGTSELDLYTKYFSKRQESKVGVR